MVLLIIYIYKFFSSLYFTSGLWSEMNVGIEEKVKHCVV